MVAFGHMRNSTHFECLTIQSAPSERNRGNETTAHRAMKVWIAQNLERYGPITPNHVFHVSALGEKNMRFGVTIWVRTYGTDPSHDSSGLNTSILI